MRRQLLYLYGFSSPRTTAETATSCIEDSVSVASSSLAYFATVHAHEVIAEVHHPAAELQYRSDKVLAGK